jgi:hypothetical protein
MQIVLSLEGEDRGEGEMQSKEINSLHSVACEPIASVPSLNAAPLSPQSGEREKCEQARCSAGEHRFVTGFEPVAFLFVWVRANCKKINSAFRIDLIAYAASEFHLKTASTN